MSEDNLIQQEMKKREREKEGKRGIFWDKESREHTKNALFHPIIHQKEAFTKMKRHKKSKRIMLNSMYDRFW